MTLAPCRAILLFAMQREAEPLLARLGSHDDVIVGFSGIGRKRARDEILRLLALFQPGRVIAAGFCGALDPSLKVGEIVTSPHILTVDHLVADPQEKARLFRQHGARAVDMESAAIAEVCAERGIPFTAVRAVSDAGDTPLSPQLVKLLSGGEVSVWKAMFALARRPSLLKEFLRLRRDTNLAAAKLADALFKLLQEPDTISGELSPEAP